MTLRARDQFCRGWLNAADTTRSMQGWMPLWDNQDKLSVSELELIEPELWFRFHPPAAGLLADAIIKRYFTD